MDIAHVIVGRAETVRGEWPFQFLLEASGRFEKIIRKDDEMLCVG